MSQNKPLSWSELDCWERDPAEHHQRYVLGIKTPPTDAQAFGSIIHQTIQDPKFPWLKELVVSKQPPDRQIVARKLLNNIESKRPKESEVFLSATTREDIPLLAIFDGLDNDERILDEYKTSSANEKSPYAWRQYTVDNSGQLSFYAYVYYLKFYKFFKEIRLHRLHTKTGTVKTFYTARGPADLKNINERINVCYQALKTAGVWDKRKSSRPNPTIQMPLVPAPTQP